MQNVWLVAAVLSGAYALYSIFTLAPDEEPEYMVFMFPFIALMLFYLRRRHNRSMAKMKENQENQENESR